MKLDEPPVAEPVKPSPEPVKPAPAPSEPAGTAPVVPKGPPVKLVSGNPRVKKIALTFDDGPHKGYTDELIRLLQELNVKATFFLIGRNVNKAPELAQKAKEAGIELANHTMSHLRLPGLDNAAIRNEILQGANAIELAAGVRPTFFRPPGGEYDDRVLKITQELGMTMVLWTSDAGDFTTVSGNPSVEAITKKVMRYVRPGGIVIMHDPMPSTLQALPNIVMSLRAQGYEFVTVSELAADPRAVTTGGPRIKPNKDSAVQALVDQGRYPGLKSVEEPNANSEQRTPPEAAPQRKEGQGIDQTGRGGGKGIKVDQGKLQDQQTGGR